MERAPGVQMEYEHVVLRTDRTADLQEAILDASARGYSIVGTAGLARSYLALGARTLRPLAASTSLASPSEISRRTVRLRMRDNPSAMQDQLNEAGALGHAVLGALAHNPDSRDGELSVILETGAGRRDQYEYRVVTTSRTSTLQNELNEAAEESFRLLPGGLSVKPTLFQGLEILVLMEKTTEEPSYEYLLLSTRRESTLQEEVSEAVAQGYAMVGRIERAGDHIACLERPKP